MINDVKWKVVSNRFVQTHPNVFDGMSIFIFFFQKLNYISIFFFFFDGCFLRSIIIVWNGTPWEDWLWGEDLVKTEIHGINQENRTLDIVIKSKQEEKKHQIQSIGLTFRLAIWYTKMLISSKLNWNYYSYFRGVMRSSILKISNHLFVKTNCYHVIMIVSLFLFFSNEMYVLISQSSWSVTSTQLSFNIGRSLEKLITNWSFIQFWTAEEQKKRKKRRHRFPEEKYVSMIIWAHLVYT